MSDKFLEDFLRRISYPESSYGTNTDHPEVKHGVQKGKKAVGSYGIMENTAKEMAKRNKLKYTPNDKEAALLLADHLAKKTGADEEAMAAGWLYGHNLPIEKLNELKKSDYVKKYLEGKLAEDNKSSSKALDDILKLKYGK